MINYINYTFKNFNKTNKQLLLTLLFAIVIPIIYQSLRILWVTNNGSDNYAMVSFNSYLQAFEEIFTTFIILPLFTYKKEDYDRKSVSIFSSIICASLILFILLLIISIPMSFKMKDMNPNGNLNEFYSYLSMDAFSKSAQLIISFFITEIVIGKENLKSIVLTTVSILISFLLDFILLSDLIFQSKSILFVSFSKVISSILMLSILIPLFSYKKINNKKSKLKINFSNIKEFYKRGIYPGLDQLIANFFYIFVTLNIVDSLDIVGWNSWHLGMWIYWHIIFKTTNIFRYSLMSETLNNNKVDDKNLTYLYSFFDTLIFIILGPLLTYFKLPNIIQGSSESNLDWLRLTMTTSFIMIPFMLTMAIGDKLKVKMIAENKLNYLLINTTISNFLVEFPIFIMLLFGFNFSYIENFIIWMSVIFLSFVINVIQYFYLIKKLKRI